jgi:hypothetical protein
MKKVYALLSAGLLTTSAFAQVPEYGDYEIYFLLTGNSFSHNTMIYFNDAAVWDPNSVITAGWDDCCEATMILGNTNQPHIYTAVVAGNPLPPGENRMQINALPLLTGPYDVPMGFYVGTAGTYTLEATRHWTFASNVGIILEDMQTQTMQDLNVDSSYVFTSALSDNANRFIVHFDLATGIDQASSDAVRMVPGRENLMVTGAKKGGVVELFDMSGRCAVRSTVAQDGEVTVNFADLGRGIYVARYQGANGVVVRKFMR